MKRILLVSAMAVGVCMFTGCNKNSPQNLSINAAVDQEQVAATCNPYFSKQPVNATRLCGDNFNWATFSVTVSGAPVSQYQWYWNTDGGANRTACSGRYFGNPTTATLTVAPDQTRYLWCWARANCGTQIWSNRVKMTLGPVAIASQPADRGNPCGNYSWVNFSVRASGATSYTYEWFWSQYSNGPFYSCINDKYFTGGDSPNLSTYPVMTKWIKCVVTGPCGQTATTRTAKFTFCK